MFHQKIKTALVAVGLCLLLASLGQAQSYDNHSIKKGAWSCQFQIGPNFNFENFDDAMFSIKRQFWNKSALRLGFSLNYVNSDQNRENTRYYPDTTILNLDSSENDNNGFDFNLLLLKYGDLNRQIKVYYGLGPRFSYDKSETQSLSGTRLNKSEQTQTEYGAIAALGGEWFVNKAIALMFEYSVSGFYQSRDIESITYDDGVVQQIQKTEYNTYRFDGFDVKFGVSVYF